MTLSSENKSNTLTNSLLIGVIVIAVVGFSITYVTNLETTEPIEDEITLNTGFQVQNLKGDSLSTYIGWKAKTKILYYIDGADRHPEEKIQAIHDVILSDETIEVPNKLLHKFPVDGTTTFYKGWIKVANELRAFTDKAGGEPVIMEHVKTKAVADVIIELINNPHPEGYSGWTTSVVDQSTGQVVQSKITLYNFDKLSVGQVEVLMRHEAGHVIGLAHSTDPDDLMYPVIQTNFPYISPCSIVSLKAVQLEEFKTKIICDE